MIPAYPITERKLKYFNEVLFPMMDTLFCERYTSIESEYHWGHEIGKIFISLRYVPGNDFVTGYFSADDEVGDKIYGQLDLVEYIWWRGYHNKGSKDDIYKSRKLKIIKTRKKQLRK